MNRHDATPAPTLRVRGPGDLLQAVPYLLGFHPHASLVLIGLADGHLVVTVRIDLADLAGADLIPQADRVGAGTAPERRSSAGQCGAARGDETEFLDENRILADGRARDDAARAAAVGGVLPSAVHAMVRGGAREVIAAVYDDTARPSGGEVPLPGAGVAAAIDEACASAGCILGDVLLVAEQRWWSYTCASTSCCPAEGRRVPEEPSAIRAAATYAGMVALPDRDALAALLDPSPAKVRTRLEPILAEFEHEGVQAVLNGAVERTLRSIKRAIFAAARASDRIGEPSLDHLGRRGASTLDDATVARFGVALAAFATRDPVWMAIDDGRLDGRELWRELARRLPSPYDATPLFLFGWASWRAGNGALAGIAAQRAVDSDPAYSAADLLLAALAHGVDPRRLPKLRLPRSA